MPTVVAAAAVLCGSAAATEYRCERADAMVRRVEIAVEDPARGVPCEVVYWKDQEEPGVRNVLWNAQTDAAFCERKAKELVATLEEGGWVCAARPDSTPPDSRPIQAEVQRPTTEDRQPGAAQPPADTSAEDAEAQAEAPAAAQQPTADQAVDQERSEQEEPAIKAALAPGRRPEGTSQAGKDEPATGQPQRTALNDIIEQNLVRLNDGVEGEFAAEIGRYGDLDGDGLEDGLVFFTYKSARLGEARFVAAYLYDGESYALAATKPLAGSDDRIHSAEVEAIEGGVISLQLNVLEPGDAACCPSGSRHQTLVLQDGQLVEVNSSASPRTDNPS